MPPPDDCTRAALQHLRARRAARTGTWRDRLYVLYVGLLVLGVYLVPYLLTAARSSGGAFAPLLPSSPQTATAVAALGFALLAVLAATDGACRGPVVVDPPALHWLLATPVSRPVVLARRWWRAVGGWAVAGGALGLLLTLAVRVGRPGQDAALLAALPIGVSAGSVYGAACAALAGAVQRLGDSRLGRSLRLASALPATAAAALGLLAAGGVHLPLLTTLVSWSGPWGWAARLITAAPATDGHGVAPDGPTAGAAVLLAVCTAVAVQTVGRQVRRLPGTLLRARVERLHLMTGAAYSLDFRLVRVIVQGAPTTRRRLPPPGSPSLALPWRVLVGWLRRPSGLVTGTVVLLAVQWLAAVAPVGPDTAGIVATVVVVAAAYAGVGSLLEVVRTEADDVCRSRGVPLRFRSLVTRTTLPPAVTAVAVAALGYGAVAAVDPARAAVPLLLVAGTPLLAATAAVSACRGPFPLHLLLGSETPMGNTGPVQAALWYARAPLVAVGILAPVLWWASPRPPATPAEALLAALPGWAVAIFLSAATVVALFWARGRADRLYRTWR